MKKLVILNMVLLLNLALVSGCGSNNSAVDAVIQNQIENSDNTNQTESEVVESDENDTADTESIDDNQEEIINENLENNDNNVDSEIDETSEENTDEENTDKEIDVDLTVLSSTMVYSEVYNMMSTPEDYIGKNIKMSGLFSFYQNEETGQMYFACIINDATACCSQGIEFELAGKHTYPDDYPEVGTLITVSGIFETYEEEGSMYCRLKDARMY